MSDQTKFIYMAAGLFNVETNMVNAYLTEKLESYDYNSVLEDAANQDVKCYLPQRDGFETGKIAKFLQEAKKFDPEIAHEIVLYVPYYLDLGFFMSRSIAVVANLDEPIDVGLIVEIAYAKICNIPVIGLRSDLRTPLGNRSDKTAINPFVVEQCDCYMRAATPSGDYAQVMKESEVIVEAIYQKLLEYIPKKKNQMNELDNEIFKNILEGSDKLFCGIEDNLHNNMAEIAKRFSDNRELLTKIAPEVVVVPEGADGDIQ